MDIRLNRVYYPVTALGYGSRLGIWMQGCHRECPGCISPELRPCTGPMIALERVIAHIPKGICPDGMTVSGGEPFDQPQALRELVDWFCRAYGEDVLIYTGYTIEELRLKNDSSIDWILQHIAALADGAYVEARNKGIGLMGSDNQRLHVFRFEQRYTGFDCAVRRMQCVQEAGRLFMIGIPPKTKREEENDD